MESDISRLLEDWPYEPGKVNVRIIHNARGETLLQMRVDLGILQMHLTGRPDGTEPDGYESLFEAAKARLEAHERSFETDEGFVITPEQCRALREEAVQYYHRYICLGVLEQYKAVERDTTRNLELVEFCARYAAEEADRRALAQVRPHLLMIRAKARAGRYMDAGEREKAVAAIEEALEGIAEHFAETGNPDAFEETREVQILHNMLEDLPELPPADPEEELQRRLETAVAQENYELAAILRDELRIMRESSPHAP